MSRKFMERYSSILERSTGVFSREFGYELADPFDEICAMLATEEAFAFSRFGDGEFNAIFGASGANCDGHLYFPDLGDRLRQILASEPTYRVGLQALAILVHGVGRVRSLSGNWRWGLADSLHLALLEGRLGRFFDAMVSREVLLVGPGPLRQLAARRSWDFVEIPARNCWERYEPIRVALERHGGASGTVFLFCASMMANVLIEDLHRLNPQNSYIDVGSVFDPYAGVTSRPFHEELDPTQLR